jgi:hypothetical protein
MRKRSLSLTSRGNPGSTRTAREGSQPENQAPAVKTATIPRESQTPTARKTGTMAKARTTGQMAARTQITRKAETVQAQAAMAEVVTEGAEAINDFKKIPVKIHGDFWIIKTGLLPATLSNSQNVQPAGFRSYESSTTLAA